MNRRASPTAANRKLMTRRCGTRVIPVIFVSGGRSRKRAVTVVLVVMITSHDPVPEQPSPDQPTNVELDAGVALRMTFVPTA